MKLEMPCSDWSDSPPKPQHFFKIILSDTESQTKLMIPKKFVSKYGNKLGSRISLKAPNGLVWKVNLERDENEVWLQDGWPQFAKFYSIQFGHLLFFKYRGHCDFKVRIFDPSCTEMDYPSSRSAKLKSGESSKKRKRAIKTDHLASSDLNRPCKKRVNRVCLKPKLQKEKRDSPQEIDEARVRALASAEAFKSDNPVFLRVMKISHVDGKRRGLVVSKAFEETYKKWKDNDQVHLQVAGRIWPLNCIMKWNRCRLSSGWDKFAQDNSLSVGDVCVFELINTCTKLLEVHILSAAKETNENTRLPRVEREAKEAKVPASVDAFTSRYPFFRINVYPSSLSGGSLGLPQKFVKRFITKDSCNVTLRISDGREWLLDMAKPSSFFKIIVSNADHHSKLMIPKKFASIHRKNLDDKISLKVPSGSVWPIKLKRHKNKVWLQKGWPEFAEHYSIGFGYLLVFEYQGNSKFQVLVFDPSGLETDYPLTSTTENRKVVRSARAKKRVVDSDDSTSVDVVRPCKRTTASSSCKEGGEDGPKVKQEQGKRNGGALASAKAFKSQNPSFIHVMKSSNVVGAWPNVYITNTFEEAYKKWKNNDKVILRVEKRRWTVYCSVNSNQCRFGRKWGKFARENSLNVDDVCVFELINPSRKLLQVLIFREEETSSNSNGKSACNVKKDPAIAAAKDFKSEKPYFIVSMTPSHIKGSSGMHITKTFEEVYKKWMKNVEVILEVGGKTWPVFSYFNLSNDRCALRHGWADFARDNSLKVGDVCVFELINPSKKLLKVHISNNIHQVNQKALQVTSEAEVSAKAFRSENPFFKINMRPSYVDGRCLSVPKIFVTTHITRDHCNVILQSSDGRSWPVKCTTSRSYRTAARFTSGWRNFAHANSLAVGDVCVFELISHSKKLINVSIFPLNMASFPRSSSSNTKPKRFFKIILSDIGSHSSLVRIFHYIPKTFKEAYKKWKYQNQILLEAEGRIWPVTCSLYSNCNQCRIRQGWAQFARDNSLNAGDVCVFELINPSTKLLQVLIFRATKEAENLECLHHLKL
ncbi:hypothetical protein ACET3Z_003591 [Daucus carota]